MGLTAINGADTGSPQVKDAAATIRCFRELAVPSMARLGCLRVLMLTPLSCIPSVAMQKVSQGPNWTENLDNAVKTEYA
jgi:hypothetical protein